jgi:MFS family permease
MATALFGIFSTVTAYAWDLWSLAAARLLTGVGLGAALPNLIVLNSESAGERMRGFAVSLIYCGILGSLAGLGMSSQLESMVAAGFLTGSFATGGQSVLYAPARCSACSAAR